MRPVKERRLSIVCDSEAIFHENYCIVCKKFCTADNKSHGGGGCTEVGLLLPTVFFLCYINQLKDFRLLYTYKIVRAIPHLFFYITLIHAIPHK